MVQKIEKLAGFREYDGVVTGLDGALEPFGRMFRILSPLVLPVSETETGETW